MSVRLAKRLFGGRFIAIALAWLAFSAAPAQATTYALGTATLLVGPAAGSNSVVLAVTPQTGVWTATTNAAWLHLSPANQSGTGSTNVVFSYDAWIQKASATSLVGEISSIKHRGAV